MTFNEVLSQTIAMLQQHGRVSYRALKCQFALDDPFLEDLKYELIAVQQGAVDQDGTVLHRPMPRRILKRYENQKSSDWA